MPSTVVGRFHPVRNAENAIHELATTGFSRGDISLLEPNAPWEETLGVATLIGMHVPADDAVEYSRAIVDGWAVVVVQAGDREAAERAFAVFDQAGGLNNLRRALSGDFEKPASESDIQAAHLRNSARWRTEVPPTRIYDRDDSVSSAALADFEDDWRRSFQEAFQNSGYRYEQLSPAYRYGAELAVSQRFGQDKWNEIERAVRRDWERRNPHTWDQAGKAICYAWQSVRARIMMPSSENAEDSLAAEQV